MGGAEKGAHTSQFLPNFLSFYDILSAKIWTAFQFKSPLHVLFFCFLPSMKHVRKKILRIFLLANFRKNAEEESHADAGNPKFGRP